MSRCTEWRRRVAAEKKEGVSTLPVEEKVPVQKGRPQKEGSVSKRTINRRRAAQRGKQLLASAGEKNASTNLPVPYRVPTKKYRKDIDPLIETEALLEWAQTSNFIYFKEFCLERGYSHHRLHVLAESCPELEAAMNYLKTVQETKLVVNGINGCWDKTMCVFALKNVAGWRDNDQAPGPTVQLNITVDYGEREEPRAKAQPVIPRIANLKAISQ